MPSYTNMTWPDDPYGTGQLWRKEPLLLAGFTVGYAGRRWPSDAATSYAVVYLRLHRTQAIDLTPGMSFGFRAVSTGADTNREQLLGVLDLDALRARRLAKVVAGWRLADDLAAARAQLGDGESGRGINGLADSWASRDRPDSALAQMCDVADHQPGSGAGLATLAASSGLNLSTAPDVDKPPADREAASAAWSVTRALVYALLAGRSLHRFTWEGHLDIGAALTANGGDFFTPADFAEQPQPTA